VKWNEYSPHFTHYLSCFRVLGMLAAARAEFLQAQTLFYVLLVLGCLIVALFAVGARH
jgi:hypothetical protein